jgi:hypothetical protein
MVAQRRLIQFVLTCYSALDRRIQKDDDMVDPAIKSQDDKPLMSINQF